jgi:hypothetical protein
VRPFLQSCVNTSRVSPHTGFTSPLIQPASAMRSAAQKERWRRCSLWLDVHFGKTAPHSLPFGSPGKTLKETKQERRYLTGKAMEELAAVYGVLPTAPDEFPDKVVNGLDTLTQPRAAWDPFEVWRTRVRGPSGDAEA